MNIPIRLAASALLCASGVCLMLARSASAQSPATAGARDVEEVFVYLAVRTNRAPAQSDPTCNDAGFAVRNRNDSELQAISLTGANARVEREMGATLGNAVACFGDRSDTGVTEFYSRLTINGIRATGRGQCRQQYSDFPEPRVGVQDCWLKLDNVSNGYVGGFLTVSTLATRVADATAAAECTGGPCGRGLESDPPSYQLPAITTVRLWRSR